VCVGTCVYVFILCALVCMQVWAVRAVCVCVRVRACVRSYLRMWVLCAILCVCVRARVGGARMRAHGGLMR
jgi:hypothetical protein